MMGEEMKCPGCDLSCIEVGFEIKLTRYVEIGRKFAVDEGRKEEWRL
jgi:hypothetical protein